MLKPFRCGVSHSPSKQKNVSKQQVKLYLLFLIFIYLYFRAPLDAVLISGSVTFSG